MSTALSNQRPDLLLELMLYRSRKWSVLGPHEEVLFEISTLFRALEEAKININDKHIVYKSAEDSTQEIVIFPDQIKRMLRLLADREMWRGTSNRMHLSS